MRRHLFEFSESDAYQEAEKMFIKACGFDMQKPKHQRMMQMGAKVREDGVDGIKIRAMLSFCDASVLKGNRIEVGEQTLEFPYLEKVDHSAVVGIYFYGLTVGECYFSSEENIMDFLYADIWGTNYVDASMHLLKSKIEEDIKKNLSNGDDELYLSREFGPGYFGMPVDASKSIMKIIDGEQMGIRVKDSGLIIPQKSCMGFYFVYNKPGIQEELSCIKCRGNSKGCEFCRLRIDAQQ